jgi:hypothetical protein
MGIVERLLDMLKEVSVVLGELGLLFVLFIAVVLLYLITKRKEITYYIEPSVADSNFTSEVRKILHDSSINNTHIIKEVLDVNIADIHIELTPRDQLNKFYDKDELYPGTNRKIWFSFTTQYPKPRIYIDEINWLYGVTDSKLSLTEYRRYVIQHEFMHALGYDHQVCDNSTAPNGVCPVLYQATRGCPSGFKCGYKVTPYDYNKKIIGSYFK